MGLYSLLGQPLVGLEFPVWILICLLQNHFFFFATGNWATSYTWYLLRCFHKVTDTVASSEVADGVVWTNNSILNSSRIWTPWVVSEAPSWRKWVESNHTSWETLWWSVNTDKNRLQGASWVRRQHWQAREDERKYVFKKAGAGILHPFSFSAPWQPLSGILFDSTEWGT